MRLRLLVDRLDLGPVRLDAHDAQRVRSLIQQSLAEHLRDQPTLLKATRNLPSLRLPPLPATAQGPEAIAAHVTHTLLDALREADP